VLQAPQGVLNQTETFEALRKLQRQSSFLPELGHAQLELFAQMCAVHVFTKGEMLFTQGEMATWFGVLLSGSVLAFLQDEAGQEISLGMHSQGECLGLARCIQWERSIARPFSIRAAEDGMVAVVMYDHLQELRKRHPKFYYELSRGLLEHLADAAAGFFLGCPLSVSVQWPTTSMSDKGLLDHLLKLHYAGRLPSRASGMLDYDTMVALSMCARPVRWEARSTVSRRGMPLSSALLVLDGKLTGFTEAPGCGPAGASASLWLEAGDMLGLDSLLGGAHPCSCDVFAARDTVAAVIQPADLQNLAREKPACAIQLHQCFLLQYLRSLAPQPQAALMLMAEGATRLMHAPGDLPAQVGTPSTCPRGLPPTRFRDVLRIAEATRLTGVGGHVQQSLGSFLSHKLQISGEEVSLKMSTEYAFNSAQRSPAASSRPGSAPATVKRGFERGRPTTGQRSQQANDPKARGRPIRNDSGVIRGKGTRCCSCGNPSCKTPAMPDMSLHSMGRKAVKSGYAGNPDGERLKLSSQASLIASLRQRVAELEGDVLKRNVELAEACRERDELRSRGVHAL